MSLKDRPITERQREILVYLLKLDDGHVPPSQIAYGIGMDKLPPVEGSGAGWGRGSGHRVFNPAQRIISSLIGLHRRGLIYCAGRTDGLSGSAYGLTPAGEEVARKP